jgi:type I restriction enzyme S subunit
VADVNPPLTHSLAPEDDVAFVPMAAVNAEAGAIEHCQTRQYRDVSKGYRPFMDGDVLVAKITPCFENGKIAHAHLNGLSGFGSTEFHVIRPRARSLDARYLFHFLRQPDIRRAGERRMTGSAGQRRVPESFLSALQVPLPPLAEQRRIAAILDQADALRAKRRAALAQLDALAESIFIDMFGDPATNPKGWPVKGLADLLQSASYGTNQKAAASGTLPVLRMNNITRSGEMDVTDLKYMELDSRHFDRYVVKCGDVLFNRTNSPELVGKTAVYRYNRPMAYAGYLIRLRPNEFSDSEFLSAFLNSAYAKRVLRSMCKSIIGMANINATELVKMCVIAPPVERQRRFARRVLEGERLKSTHRASLASLDALFASLQHRAFHGEL